MKILVVGRGGREHALIWKIAQSPRVTKIFCAPGNAGTAKLAENIPIEAENISSLLEFALKENIYLTVVGPEAPLVEGIVDEFEKHGLKIFGPKKAAAQLEGSKAFAKEIMKASNIPTPDAKTFTDLKDAMEFATQKEKAVVKADGLAAGKGVFVCNSKIEIKNAIEKIMKENSFGKAGEKIIIEELLLGEEASILAFCDGKNAKLMVASQDHKPVFDGDKGANTGGMGAYSPTPAITKDGLKLIENSMVKPVLDEMLKRKIPYSGVLYVGLMIVEKKPFVLEFNARFGDPETQVVLPRLESDLVEIMLSCVEKNLAEQKVEWNNKSATCVVLASGGYPEKYEKGKKISGIDDAEKLKETFVFHAGTKLQGKEIVTDGGRVLGVTSLGDTTKDSIENAYKAVSKISFEKMHFRNDIGKKALERF